MKTIIIYIIVAICSINICVAQQIISLSDLVGTEWQRDPGLHFRISDTNIIWLELSNDSIVDVDPWSFYVSNEDLPYTHVPFEETDKLFNHDMVGKRRMGSYVVSFNPRAEDATARIVVRLDKDSLWLFENPYYSFFNGVKVYGTKGCMMKYKRVNNVEDRPTIDVCNWVHQMQTQQGVKVSDYKNNRYMQLGGPGMGYKIWVVYMTGSFDKSRLLPQPNGDILRNKQGICLSTIFAKDPVTLMYQRAKALGIPNASCTELLGKNDVQINSYYGGVCGMAGTFLNMSATEAAAYAKKLYDAYVDFQNNRVTPDGLTALCGGCTLPRYNSGN